MFTTIVAVLCHLVPNAPAAYPNANCAANEVAVEEIVTDSAKDENVDMNSCMIQGQIGLANWKAHHPLYHGDQWRIATYKCVPGHYEIKGRV